jgi:hypothetical protein
MALARGHGEKHLLFGAYVHERAALIEKALRNVPSVRRGRVLPPGDVYRIWTERFFPVTSSYPASDIAREFVSVAKLPQALGRKLDRAERAVQGAVAGSGEVLLLTFDSTRKGGEER